MVAIVGVLIVIGAVVGGFLMAGGNLALLWQPAEFVVIGGAAFGSLVISLPGKTLKHTFKSLAHIFTAKPKSRKDFLDLLMLLNELFQIMRREGVIAVEGHINAPKDSAVFGRYKSVLADHELAEYICDNLKVFISSNMEPHEFDNVMETDIKSRHHHHLVAAHSIVKLSEALPGLGIVAAVLGVVVTMQMIGQPPEILGHHVGAALVGTFLGVLMCYGLIGPMGTNIEHLGNDGSGALSIVRTSILAFAQGMSPGSAVEAGRRAAAGDDRPSFEELDGAIRGAKKEVG
jgi:chemotaxis protein MotA